MQPNQAESRWGLLPTIVTVLTVLTSLLVGAYVLSAVPGSFVQIGSTLEDHACTTITDREEDIDDDSFGPPDADGRQTAVRSRVVCAPYDQLAHPEAARLVAGADGLPIVGTVLGLLLALAHLMRRTREEGPFSPEAIHRLRRFRWWAGGAVLVAVTGQWVVKGVAADLVADASWPSVDFLWPVGVTILGATLLVGACELGLRQMQEAYERGVRARHESS